jgi:hypothetical protein
MSRKGEAVPILILAIGLLLAIYTYLLPVSEKCSLIPGLADCKVSEAARFINITPGLLEKQETAVRYLLPEVQLFRREAIDVSSVLEDAKASKAWFSSHPAKAVLEAQENGRSAKLFIFVNKAQGSLKVYLNDVKVGTVSGEELQIIELDPGKLNEENEIKVIPTAPLFPFFSNTYEIGKIVLKEEYVITHNRISVPFTIVENPKDILDIKLSFRTRCFTEDNLSVYVGNEKIIEDKICRGFLKDVTDEVKLTNMTGNITFASEGNYIIREPAIDIRMKERTWPTYYFYFNESAEPVTLKLQFNETGVKKLAAYINGNALSVKTSKKEWETIINKYLIEDSENSILLIPEESVVVSKLEVA